MQTKKQLQRITPDGQREQRLATPGEPPSSHGQQSRPRDFTSCSMPNCYRRGNEGRRCQEFEKDYAILCADPIYNLLHAWEEKREGACS